VTQAGLASARVSSAQLADIVPLVGDEQWELPSACAGWRVIDVIAHLAALGHEAVEPPAPDATVPKNRERYHDLRVNQRRGWSHAEVIEEWRLFTPRQLETLEAGQEMPQADDPVVVTGLGTYPRHLLANVMAFILCHLRYDMLAPGGPLAFTLPEPTDELVSPAVEFMLAGVPQMQLVWCCASELRRKHDQSHRVRRSRTAHQLPTAPSVVVGLLGQALWRLAHRRGRPRLGLVRRKRRCRRGTQRSDRPAGPQSSCCTTWAWVGDSWFLFCI
jgi:hypothetical protein